MDWEAWNEEFEREWQEYKEKEDSKWYNKLKRTASRAIEDIESSVDSWKRDVSKELGGSMRFWVNYNKKWNK